MKHQQRIEILTRALKDCVTDPSRVDNLAMRLDAINAIAVQALAAVEPPRRAPIVLTVDRNGRCRAYITDEAKRSASDHVAFAGICWSINRQEHNVVEARKIVREAGYEPPRRNTWQP